LFPLHKSEQGFTLIEIVMVIGLLAILSVAGISVLTGSVDENRYDQTVNKIRLVRAALVGDPNMSLGGARSSFGYLGDMGGLPSTAQGLAALISAPGGASAFTVDATNRFGHGWNGPYLNAAIGGMNPLQDAWGRNFIYNLSGTAATITSYGADGIAGGTALNQDIVITIAPEQWKATVYGFLTDGTVSFTGAAQVEIRKADGNGGVSTTLISISAGTQGQFQAVDIPFGPRAVVIYQPSKAAPTLTRGPFGFMLDQAHYLLTPNLTNFNP
jgi:type II secretion system protein G